MARHRDTGDADDMLSRLRVARDPETGEPLSEREIRDQVLVFLLAGHETTAGAPTFTLYLLGRHPVRVLPVRGGPRSCIGEHFALLEATILLRTLLSRYRIEALDTDLRLRALITLRPAAPVRAVLIER